LAVAVLRGLIAPRDFLTEPIVAKTLCNGIRKRLFDGSAKMTDARIRKATQMASENLSLTLLAGEHTLCESAHAAWACASACAAKARVKKDTSGKDGYQREQDFFWIPSTKNNGEDMCVINYLRHGKKS
jgi:hypothetical protein